MATEIRELLNMKEVIEFSGLSESTIFRQVKKGKFPQPHRIADRRIAWTQEDLDEWIASRKR